MTAKSYIYAGDKDGRKLKGKVTATDEPAAARFLLGRGIDLYSLEKERFWHAAFWRDIKDKERWAIRFFQRLAAFIGAGLTISDSVGLFAQEAASQPEKDLLTALSHDLAAGSELSAALGYRTDIFSPTAVALVAAGEKSGTLHKILGEIAGFLEAVWRAKDHLTTLLIYPLLTLAAVGLTGGLLISFVLPSFAAMFGELGGELPLITRFVLALGEWLLDYGWLGLSVLLAAFAALGFSYRRPRCRLFFDEAIFSFPVIGTLLSYFLAAEIAAALHALLSGGVPLNDALSATEKVPANFYLAKKLARCRRAVEEGQPLARFLAAEKDPALPPVFIELAFVGSHTGDMAAAFRQIAEVCRFEADRRLKRLETVIEPLFLFIVGGFVAVIVFAVAVPLLDSLSLIG